MSTIDELAERGSVTRCGGEATWAKLSDDTRDTWRRHTAMVLKACGVDLLLGERPAETLFEVS